MYFTKRTVMGKTRKTGFISVVLSTGAIIMSKFSKINKGSIVAFSLFLVTCSCFAGLNPVKGEAGNYIAINYNTMETTQLPINEFVIILAIFLIILMAILHFLF